jgi:hypothetical protein
MAIFDFLAKERTIIGPKFNCWLVPIDALAIHIVWMHLLDVGVIGSKSLGYGLISTVSG